MERRGSGSVNLGWRVVIFAVVASADMASRVERLRENDREVVQADEGTVCKRTSQQEEARAQGKTDFMGCSGTVLTLQYFLRKVRIARQRHKRWVTKGRYCLSPSEIK